MLKSQVQLSSSHALLSPSVRIDEPKSASTHMNGLFFNAAQFFSWKAVCHAAQLLKQKQYAVYQISYMVGFTDRKYFSREIKKQFGFTPSEYIEK